MFKGYRLARLCEMLTVKKTQKSTKKLIEN